MAYLDVVERVWRSASALFTPPPDLTVAQWADEFLYLSPEDSAEPGKFKTDRAPYQRGMMDAVSDASIREVVLCTSSQVGKTQIMRSMIGYHIHQDPGPILLIQPTVDMAETFSKDRLSTMIRDTPVLKSLIADPKSRSSGNTLKTKAFPGGQITMIGANAPSDLAGRPIRVVLADEVDRYPASAGTEGDPLFLARRRSDTFWNRKFVMASTPTTAGISRIWKAFETSDQRYFHLPCPHCGEFHTLKWAHMIWTGDDPDTAQMACPHCGALYGDADKLRMLHQGEWRATATSRGIAGFHISSLYSPWRTFSDVVSEWLSSKDNQETLKTFINTQLGECWEDRTGEAVDYQMLLSRKEVWDKHAIPDDIVLLTSGVDVQDDRLEYSIIGFTALEQARVIGHYQIWGPPGQPETWAQLDEALQAEFFAADGRTLRIRATCIDSGGHHTQQAYDFCRHKAGRKIVPVKGQNGARPIWPLRATKTSLSKGVKLFLVGVDTAKDALRSALAVNNPELPRYVSFADDLPDEYFKQLTAEKRVTKYSTNGVSTRIWKKPAGVRNEALDTFVYAIAALEMLKQSGLELKKIARRIWREPTPELAETQLPPPPPPTATRARLVARGSSALL